MDLPTAVLLLAILVLGFTVTVRRLRRRRQREVIFPLAPVVHIRTRPRPTATRAQGAHVGNGMQGRQSTPTLPPEPMVSSRGAKQNGVVPDRLPVQLRQHFLSQYELTFLSSLEAAVGSGHRVFRNVALDDLVLIATRNPRQEQRTAAHLQERQVDYVVVALPALTPVFALTFEDTPMTVAVCAAAGLPLIRTRVETVWTPERVHAYLRPEHWARAAS